MRIFLSYASEQQQLADQIRLKLQSAGYDLFVSGKDIRAAESYDARIRKEIATCDRFLFLASPASLAEDCYTQTELALAEERWPVPKGHIMAVVVEGARAEDLPPYLGAVSSALLPRGDVASHVAAAVVGSWPKTLSRFLEPAWLAIVIFVRRVLGTRRGLEGDAKDAPENEQPDLLPRLSPPQFRLGLEEFRQTEEADLEARAGAMMEELALHVAMMQLIPRPAGPPPTDLPEKPSARLEHLAHWAYSHGDTPAARCEARRKLLSRPVLRTIAKLVMRVPYTVTADLTWLSAHRSPDSVQSLQDWFIHTWTRTLDPADPFDRREGNRMLTGTPSGDGPEDWPPEPSPRLLVHTRMLEQALGRDDHFAQCFVLLSAVAGRLEHEDWAAPHPVGQAYADALSAVGKSACTAWGLTRPAADEYFLEEYARCLQAP